MMTFPTDLPPSLSYCITLKSSGDGHRGPVTSKTEATKINNNVISAVLPGEGTAEYVKGG